MEKLITFLDKNEIEYHENYDISLLSSIRLGCKINIVIFPKTIKSLTKLLTFLFQNKLVYIVAGNLSNMLFVDTVADCVILTSKMQDEIDARENLVSVSAGTMLTKLCEFAKKKWSFWNGRSCGDSCHRWRCNKKQCWGVWISDF